MADLALYRKLVHLRWIALAGIACVLVLAGLIFHRLPEGMSPSLWAAWALLLVYNIWVDRGARSNGTSRLTVPLAQIVVDCLALGLLVHLAGGVENPFLPLFILHVVSANIALSNRAALSVLGLSIFLLLGTAAGEATGLLPHHCLAGPGTRCHADLPLDSLAMLGGLVLTLLAAAQFAKHLTRRLCIAVEDLTREKKQLAESRSAIETGQARLKALVDCLSDAVIFLDPEGRLLYRNQSAHRLQSRLASQHGEARNLQVEILEDLPEGVAKPLELDGITYELVRSPVRSERQEELGTVLVGRDVSERLAMEKLFLHEERMNVVGQLAAAVAHEINNPIGVVCLYSQHLLSRLAPDDPMARHLQTIRRNADACRQIVGNLLKLSRHPRPCPGYVDLRVVCREALESVQPLASGRGVRLVLSSQEVKGPVWIHADGGMLQQALLNLAINAVEASGKGDVVQLGHSAGVGPEVEIEIRDHGCGIGPEQLELIGRPFYTTKSTGTGLGLCVVENVVKSHGGRLVIDSRPGEGTCMRILLPRVQEGVA